MSLSASSPRTSFSFSATRTILLAAVVAGTLDILAAFLVYGKILYDVPPGRILQGIAKGVFGNAAFTRGQTTAVYGLVFHYMITLLFTIAYFLVFPYLSFFRKHKVVSGILYGVFVWLLMNFIVLPNSNASKPSFQLEGVLWGMGLLIVFIGLPISLIVHRYYSKQGARSVGS